MRFNCRACGIENNETAAFILHKSPLSAQGFSIKPNKKSCNMRIYQCSHCMVIQHIDKPVSYYKDVIRAVSFSQKMKDFRKKFLKLWLSKYDLNSKKILEIGCGSGEYLEMLKTAGAKKIFGIENNKNNIDSCLRQKFQIKKGYLEKNFNNPWKQKFDAFTIFSFMEHWPNPIDSISSLHNILSEGAIGLIEVPNFDLIIEKGLYTEFTPDHIFYFNKSTLKLFLESKGFDILSIKVIWQKYIISAVVKKRSKLSLKNFYNVKEKLESKLHRFIDNSNHKTVIWGAGHQSLAVISVSNISSKIKYIVDSATFKQNKYTPASALLVKDPKYLLEDRPYSIIIMAAAYSDEILKIIRTNYSFINKIAILRENDLEIIN